MYEPPCAIAVYTYSEKIWISIMARMTMRVDDRPCNDGDDDDENGSRYEDGMKGAIGEIEIRVEGEG